ncbi:XshC-Cox1 family protein [Pantoea rodasii]|uniref:XshC-Cox1 family protein n=1 Tax=Pantoea rodasii TaxID=1076549 RepID=A0A2M9W9D8_9GAMM|nr:XdhC family protein [Pantoea rodasii]ORM60939.1 XshC-Cox1 family protein [Pantoea rodasii]PJZ04142.1 XshC-Cox1 family protein [Pantoea rodasii]
MQSLDLQVLKAGLEWAQTHEIWLCTVIKTYGSSPRPPGAMMVLRSDGLHMGSLSGGCVEENFIRRARQNEFQAASQLIRYGDGGHTPDVSLPCGGSLGILVERLEAGDKSSSYFLQMYEAFRNATALAKRVTLPYPCDALTAIDYACQTHARIEDGGITMTLAAPPRLVICGLSSVAVFCANFGVTLGYETIVCEHREETFISHAPLLSEGVRLIKQFPAKYLELEGCHAATAILSLTHDPRIDDLALMEAVRLPAFYIGAMGSRINSQKRLERLITFGDVSPEQLPRIHAPVGMDIGSKTPAEIALSVMADIVRHKNGLAASSTRTYPVTEEDERTISL